MSNQTSAVATSIPLNVKDKLRSIAHKNKRSLAAQIAYVLERYVEAQEDDAA